VTDALARRRTELGRYGACGWEPATVGFQRGNRAATQRTGQTPLTTVAVAFAVNSQRMVDAAREPEEPGAVGSSRTTRERSRA
jgi:hypothetical protein